MKHLGDICKINGAEVTPVSVIIGGSPCQDLSVAGKRAGLAGERSGLFVEQIRIIKEMRENDKRSGRSADAIRPRYMVWENVPGAFSSNKGEDFRVVLEETARVADKSAVIPKSAKWTPAGCIMGDGWSIAWRVHDAQFWGVPQRRKRIALVADFGGTTAPEILFERKGVSGDITESGEPGERVTKDAERGIRETSASGFPLGFRPENTKAYEEKATTLCNGTRPGFTTGVLVENHPQDSRVKLREDGICQTLDARMGMGGGNVPMVMESINGEISGTLDSSYYKGCGERQGVEREIVAQTYQQATGTLSPGTHAGSYNGQDAYNDMLIVNPVAVDCRNLNERGISGTLQSKENGEYSLNYTNPQVVSYGLDRASFNQGQNAKYNFSVEEEKIGAQVARGPGAVCQSVVRRLTPLECERLQGFPDGWTDIGDWVDSKGKKHKGESDAPRYKALGNSIALPFWEWMLKRMMQYLDEKTMASLFDGIGGFPLIWNRNGGKTLWASEIEEFPIAVTKRRFGDE